MNTNLVRYTKKFDRIVKRHGLTVLHEDLKTGRIHLEVKKTESFDYCYNIVTWPGVVCIQGDAGSYLFEDRSGWFFENDRYSTLKSTGAFCSDHLDRALYAADYLHRRVIASCEDTREFSFEIFINNVKRCLQEFDDLCAAYKNLDLTKVRDLIDELHEHEHDDCPEEIYKICEDWSRDISGCSDEFFDFTECSRCEEYTYRFTWNCLAVVHALKLYDAHKAQEAA